MIDGRGVMRVYLLAGTNLLAQLQFFALQQAVRVKWSSSMLPEVWRPALWDEVIPK